MSGFRPARVSRVETGRSLLSLSEAAHWATHVGADEESRVRLRQLVEAAHAPATDPVPTVATGLAACGFGDAAQAGRVVTISVSTVPGLLQTAEYTRALLDLDGSGPDVAGQMTERLQRQAALYDPGTQHDFLVTEDALRVPVLDPAGMADQYHWLAQATTLSTVHLRILPTRCPERALASALTLLTDRDDGQPPLVYPDPPHHGRGLTDPASTEIHAERIARMWRAAQPASEARQTLLDLLTQNHRDPPSGQHRTTTDARPCKANPVENRERCAP